MSESGLGLWACIVLTDGAGREAVIERVRREYGAGFARYMQGRIDLLEGQELVEANAAEISGRSHEKSAAGTKQVSRATVRPLK